MATAARIDIRLKPDQKSRIEKAAGIRGLSITDFIVQNAIDSANRTIQEHETWVLGALDAESFFAALLDPAPPAPALIRAAQRYKERYGE